MAAKRISTRQLTHVLDAVPQPLYVLDEELTVVFLNQPCRNWLGAAADELVGVRCTYQTPGGAVDAAAVAAGLCPPPQVLEGQVAEALVGALHPDGGMKRRRARFVPFGCGPHAVWLIVALVEAEDFSGESPDAAPAPAEPAATQLHDALRQFRRQAAGRHRLDRLAGVSAAMRLARRQAELALASRCSVLLVGPPGSGRQHLATAIHYGTSEEKGDSPHLPERPEGCFAQRGTVPFFRPGLVPLDCSVLPGELVVSTITASARAHAKDEKTGPSTLLLLCVDEIPAGLQVELTMLLAKKPYPLRVMATAAAPLVELAARGLFREDLAAALSTLTIVLPPLAQRREDLAYLAQILLEQCNAQSAKQVAGFTPAALDQLDAYGWPGNADELADAVAEAHRHAAGREIDVADLPERLHLALQAAAHPRRPEEKIVLDEFLQRVQRELIRRALARAKGNKAQAARLLGLTRPRLYRRMVQLGLE